MTSQAAIRSILARFEHESREWAGLLSMSVHGSMAKGVPDRAYNDIDLLLVFEDATTAAAVSHAKRFFGSVCDEFRSPELECFFRIQSGPMHPLRRTTTVDALIPLSARRIAFFHISMFPLTFYLGNWGSGGPSPLLLHTWSQVEPMVGARLGDLRRVAPLTVDDVLGGGLGIRDCERMIRERRRGYWDIAAAGDGSVQMTWREAEFEDFEVYELPLYAAKWAFRNVQSLLTASSIPEARQASRRSASEIRDGWLAAALADFAGDMEILGSWLRDVDEARIAYSSDPTTFVTLRPAETVRVAVLRVLNAVGELIESMCKTTTERFSLDIDGRTVPIYVGTELRGVLADWLDRVAPDRVFVLTDRAVGALIDAKSWIPDGLETYDLLVEPGEGSKSPNDLLDLLRATESMSIGPASLMLVVGGGNVGNLGGMIAGLACRGVPLIHIPTSLVAQLDSAIGGKQSVNGWFGKNYFGLYHPPTAVLINPLLLATLPRRELLSGLTEAMKHGFCQSADLVDEVLRVRERLGDPSVLEGLARVVTETIRLKLDYMRTDPRESRPDQFLELGHKVGHAIEYLCCGHMSHGECVAIGMVAESYFMAERGDVEEGTTEYLFRGLTELWGSLAAAPDVNANDIAQQVLRDNKRRGRTVPFSYLRAPQQPRAAMVDMDEGAIALLAESVQRTFRRLG